MSKGCRYQDRVELPYPPVQAGEANPAYANAMLSNIGSCNSEMSAVSLYFYNSLVLRGRYDDYAACFESVSITEMHHLEIFGRLARQLGADPRLWERRNNRYVWWTPACNSYPNEVRRLLRNAIEAEKAAIRKYAQQTQWIRDPNIVANLLRILQDEELHVRLFESMLAEVCAR